MEELIKKIQEQLDNNWPVEADDIQALIDYVKINERNMCADEFKKDIRDTSNLNHVQKLNIVLGEIQNEWLEHNIIHTWRKKNNSGIQSSQISALVMYLIKKGVL